MSQASSKEFIAAMGQHVSSVCVITTVFEGKRYGLTATAMSSVCAEPPRLLACVNKNGVSHDMIVKSGVFCVNVLGELQDNVAKVFAGMLGKDIERFSMGEWHKMSTGAPVLNAAAAAFDCKTVQTIDQFSHTIFIGEVLAASHQAQDTLLYGARKFRTLKKHGAESVADAQFW